ncbi:MAG: TolC family protein [Victivallales bacterium]|nr:TolC family protein [Victivallales bacterium]
MKAFLLFLIVFCLVFADEKTNETKKYSLDECIAYAMEHSPVLAKQNLTVMNQKLQTVIEQAVFDFKLNGGYTQRAQAGTGDTSVTLSKEFENGFDVKSWVSTVRENGVGVTSSYVAVQVSKSILGGGRAAEVRYNMDASMLDEISTYNTWNRARRKLAQDVKVAYYGIIQAQQSLLVKERALKNAEHTLALTKEREKPLDIMTAQIRIPENELAVNTAKRAILNGLDSLKELIGMEVTEPFDITGDFDYQVKDQDLKKDMEFAQDNLETFINNRLERRKLTMQEEIYDNKTIPDVKLSATHYKYGDGDGFNFNGREEQVIALNFTWNLGRNAELARLQTSRNKLESNQHDYFILQQELKTSVIGYHRRLLESADAVRLQESICDFQKRKEELYKDKWENGEIDILELVRTQTDLENANVALIEKKIAYLQLLANYEYTVGRM